jgi:hypothetical protein
VGFNRLGLLFVDAKYLLLEKRQILARLSCGRAEKRRRLGEKKKRKEEKDGGFLNNCKIGQ